MKLEFLKNERIEDFKAYCRRYRNEIDDSFLYDADLKTFIPNEENPSYIITDEQNNIKGVCSLIIDEYNKRGRRARFRIFHSEIEDLKSYSMLFQSVLKHTAGLDKLFIFVPSENRKLIKYIEEMNFKIERFSFVMIREDIEIPELNLPLGFEIRSFREGMDEQAWCDVRNAAFANLKGSETPITPDMVKKMLKDDDYIDGGLMILYHYDKPVGVVKGSNDEYKGLSVMSIGPLAILPEYQGKGLGTNLLRAILHFAKRKSFKKTILCVNAENERAKTLYLKEGFNVVESAICYRYDLK